MIVKRRAGVLLHPTSLAGPGGIGTLGTEAYRFLDFLAQAGFSLWQVLPLTPPTAGDSPYSAYSAFAGNPLLIDLDALVQEGDLTADAIMGEFSDDQTDFTAVSLWKELLLRDAAEHFFARGHLPLLEEFWHFCDSNDWLHDYALYQALKRKYRGHSWTAWPDEIALRDPVACKQASVALGSEIGVQKYQQWQFWRQWQKLHNYAVKHGIDIVGDLPIFVAHDSADVWCNRQLFLLDSNGRPTVVAGVPPDYFSATGQLWGNPLYNWGALAESGYAWWISRIRHLRDQFDLVRIDHFRGFEASWQVPATEKTAVKGVWVPGPGEDFFRAMSDAIGELPFIAEDLGVITPQVEALRDKFGLPGMKILQFAFDSDAANPYLPHNHITNCVVYTGTHDNDTTQGWAEALTPAVRTKMATYLGVTGSDPLKDLIRTALMSVAATAILPMQDVLGLSSDARMNLPGTAHGNWSWRMQPDRLTTDLAAEYGALLSRYGRHGGQSKS